jgi:hypothetical protein
MSNSTAPILLAGGATAVADYMEGEGIKWQVLLATGLAAGVFALLEKTDPPLITGVAWIAFIGTLLAPHKIAGKDSSVVQVFLNQWNSIKS